MQNLIDYYKKVKGIVDDKEISASEIEILGIAIDFFHDFYHPKEEILKEEISENN